MFEIFSKNPQGGSPNRVKANLHGAICGINLWDLPRFFDSIDRGGCNSHDAISAA